MEDLYLALATSATLLGLLLLRLLHFFWWKLLQVRKCLEDQGIRGPPFHLIFGNSREISRIVKHTQSAPMPSFSNDVISRVMPRYQSWTQKYGKDFVFWVGTRARLYFPHPELIKEILVNRNGNFDREYGHDSNDGGEL